MIILKKYLLYLFSIPKTIFFNFRYLPIKQAIRLPIFISYKVVLRSVKGSVEISDCHTGSIKIGFGYVGIFDGVRSRSIWECAGRVIFKGKANIGHGTKISVADGAILQIGDNFCVTAESQIVCFKNISFGTDVLVSWQCLIMDTDCHNIIKNNQIINFDNDIVIGNNVWIGCRSTVLKGVHILDGNVVAANSNCVKTIDTLNAIIGGNPAKILNENINWKN